MPPTMRQISDEQIARELIEALEEHKAHEERLVRRIYEELCRHEREGPDGPEWLVVNV